MDSAVESSSASRAALGDPEAVRDLWRQHRRWVAAVLLAHMPADCELDDLLQEVAVRFLRNVGELREPDLFRPWLRTIAVNIARTAGRRRKVRLRLVRPAPDEIDSIADPATAAAPAATAEDREHAARALELARELHPDYGEPLLMRCVHSMTYQQIGEALGLPVTTVETRLARARRMLRDSLSERERRPLRAAGAGAL